MVEVAAVEEVAGVEVDEVVATIAAGTESRGTIRDWGCGGLAKKRKDYDGIHCIFTGCQPPVFSLQVRKSSVRQVIRSFESMFRGFPTRASQV